MSSVNPAGDRVAIMQMNAELRNAQLEMLSAQCATDRLRLHYSPETVARHAQREVLRKACSSASALYEYYYTLSQQLPPSDEAGKFGTPILSAARVEEAIGRLADFLHAQREHFRREAGPLDPGHRQIMEPFFSASLLDQIRMVVLERERIPNPPFFVEAKALGLNVLPDITHMASLTFEDVLVFQSEVSSRKLFHALVHAVQFEVLGLERYSELFVRGFLRSRAYFNVPLEAHVFQLEAEFAGNPAQAFSVEEKVRLWTNQGRY